jgi:hypothetical protein
MVRRICLIFTLKVGRCVVIHWRYLENFERLLCGYRRLLTIFYFSKNLLDFLKKKNKVMDTFVLISWLLYKNWWDDLKINIITGSISPLLPCIALICLVLPWFALICLDLPWFALICLDLPWFALICLDLPWFALICLDLPCIALICLVLPCFALFLFFIYLTFY